MSITTVLLDLDGVVRHFDPDHRAGVESRHGLRASSLWEAAFEPSVAEALTTGAMTRAEWVTVVGHSVASPAAAEEWLSAVGTVDEELMTVVEQLRAKGVTVAVLTNGTDTIPAEMATLGLVDRFDGIFNSAEIGFAKPDTRAFHYVCEKLNVLPEQVFFTDDSEHKLTGAIELGMTAHHFDGVDGFRDRLRAESWG